MMHQHHEALLRFEAARSRLHHSAVLTVEQVTGLPIGDAFETAAAYAAAVRTVFLRQCDEWFPDPVTPSVELLGGRTALPVISHTTCTGNTVLQLVLGEDERFSCSVTRPNHDVETGQPRLKLSEAEALAQVAAAFAGNEFEELVPRDPGAFDSEIDGDAVVVALLGDHRIRPAGLAYLVNEFGVAPELLTQQYPDTPVYSGVAGKYYDHRIVQDDDGRLGLFRVYDSPWSWDMASVTGVDGVDHLIKNHYPGLDDQVVARLLTQLCAEAGIDLETRRAELEAARQAVIAANRSGSTVKRVRKVILPALTTE